jgi:threonine dehydrogenase-like Zn-dependent dehydrogenase
MRALWLEDLRLGARSDVPMPAARAGEALVRVRLAGICGTDLELVKGYYPYAGVPGHEFVGSVVSADAGEWIGRRVVGEINASCGVCATCVAGRPSHCPTRTVLGIKGRNGAMAELLTLPVENLHVVPDGFSDEVAVFVEPLAAALEVQEQVAIGTGTRIVVIGDGKLGQLVARTLSVAGHRPCVVGRHARKLALLTRLGIETAAAADLPAREADVVVECTGNPEGLAIARAAVRPRGTIVLKSTYHGDVTINLSGIVVDEVTVVGSRCGPFAPALAMLASGAITVTDLIDDRFPLGDGVRAFARAGEPGVLKVLLAP